QREARRTLHEAGDCHRPFEGAPRGHQASTAAEGPGERADAPAGLARLPCRTEETGIEALGEALACRVARVAARAAHGRISAGARSAGQASRTQTIASRTIKGGQAR